MRQTITIEIGPGHTAYLYGPPYVLHPILRVIRSPRQYDKKRRAIAIPRKFVDDAMAALELQAGVDVRVEQGLA